MPVFRATFPGEKSSVRGAPLRPDFQRHFLNQPTGGSVASITAQFCLSIVHLYCRSSRPAHRLLSAPVRRTIEHLCRYNRPKIGRSKNPAAKKLFESSLRQTGTIYASSWLIKNAPPIWVVSRRTKNGRKGVNRSCDEMEEWPEQLSATLTIRCSIMPAIRSNDTNALSQIFAALRRSAFGRSAGMSAPPMRSCRFEATRMMRRILICPD